MESTQELQHWGIKGQRWGVRRYQNPDGTLTEAGKKRYYYQNPDGSLTEAGKKDYMKAAKKGKLDVTKLSDNDLNMINSRFAREKTYKQNVSDYEKSTFKYRLKEAVLSRIKGSGGGGGGGGKKKGGNGIGNLLAMPIKKAFEEAFKDSSSGGGKDDGYDEDSKWWGDVSNKGHRFTEKYFDPEKRPGIERTKKDIERGKKHMNFVVNEMSGGRMGTFDAASGGNSYAEGLVRAAQQKKAEEKARRAAQRDAENRRQKNESKNRRKEMDTEERLKKLGFAYASHSAFVVCRDSFDELYHYGIKGQKWGIRRYENPDGTLTEEGKRHYGHIKLDVHSELNRARENQKIAAKKLMDASFLTKARAAKEAAESDEKLKEVENVYNDLLKHQKEVDEYNKREFDAAKKEIHENGFKSWWNKNRSTDNEDAFCDHIWNTQGKLLNSWWNEQYELNYDDGSWKRVQQKYVKQLANNLGLPQTKEVNEYLSDWFINGDD